LQLDGSYPISANFENIKIIDGGTHGIYLSASLSGDATFSSVIVRNSSRKALLKNSPKLRFTINFGEGNVGWRFP
jgi:hypothetical protein